MSFLIQGAADVRSTIRIVESQKEKCDELRQQFHVLQERVQYLAQLKETLSTRLNQLIEAQALSSNNSTRPTPRNLDELFGDDGSLMATPHYKTTGSINGEYQTGHEDAGEQQLDCNEALGTLASTITKICSQVNKIIVRFVSHCHFSCILYDFIHPHITMNVRLSYPTIYDSLISLSLSPPFLRYDDKEEGPV